MKFKYTCVANIYTTKKYTYRETSFHVFNQKHILFFFKKMAFENSNNALIAQKKF